MKEITIKLFTFEELSEEAKSKICDREREDSNGYGYMCQESDAWERHATLEKFCETFGIKFNVDYDHCYRFINWKFENSIDDEEICGKLLWRFLNKYYYDIRSRKYYSGKFHYDENGNYIKGSHRYRYSRIQWIEQNCPFTGMCYDCDILQKIFEWYEKPDWRLSLHDLFEECFSYFLESWEKEDEYRMSDENISDMILANNPDQLYFEDGKEFDGTYEEDAA